MDPAPTPRPLLQLITAFCGSKVVATAVELGLFGRIDKAGGLTRAETARELDIDDRPADLLLAACASLGLLDKRGDTYVNTAQADTFLVPGRPQYLGGLIRYIDQRHYPAWLQLATAVRTNSPVAWDPNAKSWFDTEDPLVVSLFWDTMCTMATYTGRALADAVTELARRSSVLDVGGGWGAVSIELCRRHPRLRATVFDLPRVCPTTERKIKDAGLDGRIDTIAGDFLVDDLPTGHDVVVLSSILHDWDEHTDRQLLAKCYQALDPGGLILISEFFLNEERTGPPDAAIMGLTMLVETPGGKNYATGEYRTWLADAGFVHVGLFPIETPGSNGVLVARKP